MNDQPTPNALRSKLELKPDQTTEQAVGNAIAVYKEAKQRAEDAAQPWLDVGTEAKAQLTDIITETGVMSWKTAAGMVYIPAAAKIVSYDAKALDALCASSPELDRILRPHRSEKERPGSLTIR